MVDFTTTYSHDWIEEPGDGEPCHTCKEKIHNTKWSLITKITTGGETYMNCAMVVCTPCMDRLVTNTQAILDNRKMQQLFKAYVRELITDIDDPAKRKNLSQDEINATLLRRIYHLQDVTQRLSRVNEVLHEKIDSLMEKLKNL